MKTKTLIAALLLAASSAIAQVPSYVPTNGLVGWWPFNGNANDESGNNLNGIINGATLVPDRNNQTNGAYVFLSSHWTWGSGGDYIYIPYNSIMNSSQITVSFWMQRGTNKLSNQRYQGLVKRFEGGYSNPNGQAWGSYIDGNNDSLVNFVLPPNTTNNYTNTYSTFGPLISTNQWKFISLVYKGDSLITYVNGVKVTSVYSNNMQLNANGTSGISFGMSIQANGHWDPYDGKLDDIGIWNRALSQQEITALYNAQSCTGTGAITPDGPTTFCAGNYVNLTSDVVGGTYQWKKNGVNITTNGTSRTYKATATGSYTCVATCNGTALTSNAITVTSKTNAAATVTASGATSFCLGDSVTLNCTNLGSNYSVQWYRTNISMENATNYSIVVKQPGTYKVVTKNLTNGCSRISGSAITTSVNCRIAGDVTSGTTSEENNTVEARLIDNELSQGVHIYPNPNNGSFSFTYEGEETGDGILQIINTMGQSIYSSAVSIQEGGYTQEINLGDNYTKGFYIVRLLINGGYHDSRVMVR
ncbi:MAG: hypothetical protein RI952_1760 [Bacteroidota bacterium]|jgi:hypothetical protein